MGKQKKARHMFSPFHSYRKKNSVNLQWCKICHTFVDLYTFQSHLNSPQHNRKSYKIAQNQIFRDKICENGVRIKDPPLELGWETIVEYFQGFGRVMAIFKLNCDCVLVQYEERPAAEIAIHIYHHTLPVAVTLNNAQVMQNYYCQSPTLSLHPVTVTVHPRRVDDQHLVTQGNLAYQPPSLFKLEQRLKHSFRNAVNNSLNDQLLALVADFEPNQNIKILKSKIMWDLSSWLFLEYPHHVLQMFGSTVMGLDLPDSDVDFYLNYNPATCATSSKTTKLMHLKRIGYILSAHPDVSNVNVIANARVPIVKFHHMPTGIMCDLMCSNVIGVKRSQFIAAMQTLDTRIRPYFLFLKLWAKIHGLLGNPIVALSSYSLVLLALFYLQRTIPSVVPSIAALQSRIPANQKILYNGWDLSYNLPSISNGQNPRISLFDLVKGFFEFFQSYDPRNVVICPLIGDTLPHECFQSNPPSLDESSFGPYLNTVKNGGQSLKLTQLTVQDPFELNNNVTSLNTKYQCFRSCCEESFKVCCELGRLEGTIRTNIARLFTSFPA